ncbi:hypothetical protein [Streptomyces adelaidensis]|uniref:hypothetical protein n=1 Tax=Streptomyces adelaidensis TaxID=2796465 RepID=UPI0019053C96|nr:hypothetical protein [Streptomyces adelaidensis]
MPYAPVAAAVRIASASRSGFTVLSTANRPGSAPSRSASNWPRAASTSGASMAASRSCGRRAPRPYATQSHTASPASPSASASAGRNENPALVSSMAPYDSSRSTRPATSSGRPGTTASQCRH